MRRPNGLKPGLRTDRGKDAFSHIPDFSVKGEARQPDVTGPFVPLLPGTRWDNSGGVKALLNMKPSFEAAALPRWFARWHEPEGTRGFPRPKLRGDRRMLRELRAAEMAAWDPAFNPSPRLT